MAESYLNSALIFENLTREIALLGRAVPEGSLVLLQKVTPVSGRNTFRVPFLNPKTGVLIEVETEQTIFKQARDSLEKSYRIPLSSEDNLALAVNHYHSRVALDLSSWLFNKIFVARFLIEQIKSGKGLFAMPDTHGLPNKFGQSLALQHYVGVVGMASDLLDDAARLSYFTLSRVVSVQAVEFSLHRIAYFSAELLSGATETSRYAFLIKGILQKDHIQHVMKKLVNGISKTFMGLGLILSATDIVLTTSALLNAPNNDAQMILGIQLGFSVLGFGLQLFAIGAALLGATSLALALGAAVLAVAIIGVVIIFLLEHFQQKINTIKASAQFFKNLKKSWKQGYVLKQGCFIHERPACITLLELGVLERAFRIAFGTQRYQAYGSTFIGGVQSELRKLNVLKPFRRADVSVTELPPNNEQDDILTHNLVLPCVAQTDYDFSYDRGVAKIEGYGSSEAFAPLRELEKKNKDFVFFHKRHINDVQRGMVRSIYYEMQEIIPTRKLTNIWVTISENQFVQNQWALHFPWAETKEDYSQEYTVFKKENPDWEKFGSGYEQFKEKITATEQAFRQDIIDNASEITYHMDNTSNLCQILVLPPVAFPLKLHLQGGNWLISALTLGVITLPSRKNTQLQIGGHEIELMLTADESIQIQCLIHEKVTLIQNITASEMDIASIVFDASKSPANSLKAELNLLYEQQIKTLSDADRLPSLLIKNYQEEAYQGNAHYVTKNGAILWVPAFASFKFSIACARLLTIEAEKVFFYTHIDLNTQTNGKLKTRESPFQPTFWITHSRSSLLEFVNYSFLPLFTSSNGLKSRVKIKQVGEQLTLIEHFKKGTSSVAVHYAINITPTAHNPLLLRKIQCSSDIFSVLVQNELFFGERSSQTTLKQLRGLLCTMLLDIYLLDDYPGNHNQLNKKSSGGEIYADEIIQITDNENTEAYWWSRSCGILAPITLPTGKQEKIKPIWSGRNDYQRVSFWMSTGNQTPVDNENEEGKLYIKHDTEPYIDYSKLGLLKHVGHTPERLYTEDTQGNIYAIDVSGRAYLSTIGSRWLTNHQDDLSTAFTALLALNDNEADERFHLPVLGIEGFLCGVSTHNTKSLQTWYETHLKRFYFYYSSHGQKLHYLTHDTQEKAAFWDPHKKTLLYISSISLDEVQTFNPLIPENRLPPVEIILYGVQKAWKNEELLYLENNQLIFFSDFKQSPYHFFLQGIAEGYVSPYLLSYQLASALKKEFYRVFSDENRAYTCDHYAIWQTHIPNTPPGAQDLFTINFTERKTQIWKMLIEKIVKRTPECLSVTSKNMWSFLAAHLARFLPKARLHVDDINNMIREAFIAIRKSGACNIELKPKRLLRFSQYGWYNTQLSALFMIPKERDKHVDYQYLGLSRDGYHSYVSAEEKRVYKISGLQEWEMVEDWPAGGQKIADLLCIKRFGDELIYIEKKSTLSGLQKNLAFSAYFLADIKEIKTLYPRQKSATLLIQLQNWSAITFVIQAHNRAFEEDVELIIEKEDLGTYKVQREEQDLWIFQTQRKFALCVSNVLNTEPVPEDIDLKVVNESIAMAIPLNQLIEKYNHQADQPETFYDEVVYPIYILSDLLNSPP